MPDSPITGPVLDAEIDRIFRAEHGRVVGVMMRRFGDLDIAEDATSEALVVALSRWPQDGIPPNPGAWLTTTAGNKALDRLRRESSRDEKQQEATAMIDPDPAPDIGPVDDDRLRLIFICCHPALALDVRIALTLRMLGGLTAGEIAAAFLVPEATMAKRLVRAKKKIKQANIPYRIPSESDVAQRLDSVLTVLYLVFNEGYLPGGTTDPAAPARDDLALEAIRLVRALRAAVASHPAIATALTPEVDGLLALMLLTQARRPARFQGGTLVTLDRQDRTRWDAALVTEGHGIVRRCLALDRPGRYQYLAAINAVHTDALDASMTDWSQIVQLYNGLVRIDPSPVAQLNRAIAVAEMDGPDVALALVDKLNLLGYHAFHVTRAELLRRLHRDDEAVTEYDLALNSAGNPAEAAHLTRRRGELTGKPMSDRY